MFPEGWAFVNNCRRCDDPVIVAYCEGRKVQLHTWSVRYADACLLSRYWDMVYRVWPDFATGSGLNSESSPLRFHVSLWRYTYKRPVQGRLYVRHLCGIVGKWSISGYKGNVR